MPHETQAGAADATAKVDQTNKTVAAIGLALAALEPGPLADLRREAGDPDAPRPAAFWRLATKHELIGPTEDIWLRIIRIMAILTARGAPEGKASPHRAKSSGNNWRGLGAALCDGGDPQWGIGELDPRPMLSELRFARLLAAKGDMRADLMERAARALAAKKPVGSGGVDCSELAKFLLFPDDPEPGRRLARSYYARLDRTKRNEASDAPDTAAKSTGDDE